MNKITDALKRAEQCFKSKADMAKHLGYTSSMAIRQWEVRGNVPARKARDIQRLTNNQVMAYELCPELFDPPSETKPASSKEAGHA